VTRWTDDFTDLAPKERPVGRLRPLDEPRAPCRRGLRRRNKERHAARHAVTFGPQSRMARLGCCVVPGCRVAWPQKIEAAHVLSRGAGGRDEHVVGLCPWHHRLQGDLGIRTFQRRFKVDLEHERLRLAELVRRHDCMEWLERPAAPRCAVCWQPVDAREVRPDAEGLA
jgi:hypothetical protein